VLDSTKSQTVSEWLNALDALLSARLVAFVNDPVELAYTLSLLMAAANRSACMWFHLGARDVVLLTTCRVAADVFTAVFRDGGVLFPVSGRTVSADSPYYATRFSCGPDFTFGIKDLMPVQRKLAQFLRHVRIVELEDEPCDVCRVMPRSYSA
jgi:hypothetical protein